MECDSEVRKLSEDFFADYSEDLYPEILRKDEWPYTCLLIDALATGYLLHRWDELKTKGPYMDVLKRHAVMKSIIHIIQFLTAFLTLAWGFFNIVLDAEIDICQFAAQLIFVILIIIWDIGEPWIYRLLMDIEDCFPDKEYKKVFEDYEWWAAKICIGFSPNSQKDIKEATWTDSIVWDDIYGKLLPGKYVSDPAAVGKSLMNRFGLSEESAMKKVQQYWKS